MVVPRARSARDPAARIAWRRVVVYRRTAWYAVAGPDDGLPALFLHGWALDHLAYREAIRRLAGLGCRVWAPALPGFGGTPELSARHFSFEGFAGWVDGFATAVGVDEPAFVVGHSFGGGVAIRFAHDYPARVRTLVLVNSVGGAAWRGVRSMAERPLWDWGLHLPSDVLPLRQVRRVIPVILEDAVPNQVRNPRAVWRVAQLARRGLAVEAGDVWFAASAVASATGVVAGLLAARPDGVTVAEVRDALGTSRKHVLPLLGHLDATGATRRRGDVRVAGPRLPAREAS